MFQTQLAQHAIDQGRQTRFRGGPRQSQFGRKVNGLAGCRGNLQGIVLGYKRNALADINVGGIDTKVVETDIGLNLNLASRDGTAGENVQQGSLIG